MDVTSASVSGPHRSQQPPQQAAKDLNKESQLQPYNFTVNYLFSANKVLHTDKKDDIDVIVEGRNSKFEGIYCFDDSEDDIREVSRNIRKFTSSNHKNFMKSRKTPSVYATNNIGISSSHLMRSPQ